MTLADAWPNWLREKGAKMRLYLSASTSYGHCAICGERRRCRYALEHDVYFCSESCWTAGVRRAQAAETPDALSA